MPVLGRLVAMFNDLRRGKHAASAAVRQRGAGRRGVRGIEFGGEGVQHAAVPLLLVVVAMVAVLGDVRRGEAAALEAVRERGDGRHRVRGAGDGRQGLQRAGVPAVGQLVRLAAVQRVVRGRSAEEDEGL